MEDLIGRKVYYSGGWYNSDNYLTVCGISNDESYSAYVAPDKFDDIITVNYVSTYYYIDTVNKEETMSRLSEYKTVLDSVKDGRRNYFKSVVEDNIGKIIGLAVITLALALYIILMSRSSMFKMIKNIGILRTVGAKKKDIINIFIGDMFALTTKSSLIAYVVANLLILFTKIRLNLSNFGMSLLAINPISFFLGIILIYALNIFAAIIPIMILNHKTPIEVVKKYDI